MGRIGGEKRRCNGNEVRRKKRRLFRKKGLKLREIERAREEGRD